MAPTPITGAALPKVSAGQTPPARLEINVFVKNEKHFSLYVQALQAVQLVPQQELLSFFQIAGIHGLPYTEWNESPGGERGYCAHSSNIFPTWHRPYVALIEQAIQAHAVQIAATYKVDTKLWEAAATTLRQPYWDWALNAVPPPEIISEQKVAIITPDGNKTLVDNPFLRYKFNPEDSYPVPPSSSPPVPDFLKYKTTLRHPKYRGTEIVEDIDELKRTLSSAQSEISEDTFDLFSLVSWEEFSNNAPSDGFSSSLETIHGSIHVKVGGQGHMSRVPFAAFDPIFYMHHCQVDRLLSMWSTVHPGVWVPNADLQKNLTPFWNKETSFWVSANVRTGNVLNYCYPEVTDDIPASQQAIYVWLLEISKNIRKRQPELLKQPSAAPQALLGAASPPVGTSGSNSLLDWSVRIRCNQYEFGDSFSVYLFLTRVPDEAEEWVTSPYFIGSLDAFVNSSSLECENCRNNADRDIEGYVHINAGILQYSGKESLEVNDVKPFLEDNLLVRVVQLDGTVSVLKTLQVGIVLTPITLPFGADLPVANRHYEIPLDHATF